MTSKEEVINFLKNLNIIMQYGKDLVLIDKDSPRMYRIPKETFLKVRDNLKVNPALIKDYVNLKRWSYLPDPEKLRLYNSCSSSKLSLRVSEDCTLACKYCFNKDNMLNSKKVKYMSKEIGVKALNFFFSHFKKRDAWVIFYGGEPLMNFSLIKYITDYMKKNIKNKQIQFRMITNGTVMNKDIIKWLLDNNMSISVTLDFPVSEQNRNRPFRDGSPSFEAVKNNILMLAKNIPAENLCVRSVIPKDSNFTFSEIYESFYKSGIPTDNYSANPQFITHPEESTFVRLNIKNVEQRRTQVIKRCRQEFIKSDTVPREYKQDLCDMYIDVIMDGRQPLLECDTVKTNAISVNPIGEIYFCDIKANKEEFYLGNINTGLDEARLKRVKEKYCFELKECSSCWAQGCCQNIICPLTRPDKEGREQNCSLNKRGFINALKFFLSLDYKQIQRLIQFTTGVNKRNNYVLCKPALEIHKFLNDTNKYIRPINVTPY